MSHDATPPPMPEYLPQPPAKKSRTIAVIIGGAIIGGAAIIAVGVVIANNDSGSKGSAAAETTPAADPAPSKDPAQRFVDWANNGGSDTLNTLSTDLSAVDADSDPIDFDGLRDSCSTLTADVEAAQDGEPMPDKATAKRWNLALEHLANSATACTEGAVSEDQASFDLMASEMDIGIKHLNAVNKHLDEVLAS